MRWQLLRTAGLQTQTGHWKEPYKWNFMKFPAFPRTATSPLLLLPTHHHLPRDYRLESGFRLCQFSGWTLQALSSSNPHPTYYQRRVQALLLFQTMLSATPSPAHTVFISFETYFKSLCMIFMIWSLNPFDHLFSKIISRLCILYLTHF